MLIRMSNRRSRFGVSLRVKLTLWMVTIFLVIQLMLAMVVYFYQRQVVSGYFQERVQARADSIARTLKSLDRRVDDDELYRLTDNMPDFALKELWCITVYDREGAVVASTRRPAPSLDAARLERVLSGPGRVSAREVVPGIRDGADDSPEARLDLSRFVNQSGERLVLLVARSDKAYDSMMAVVGRMMALTLPAGLIAAAGAGWVIAGLAITPLRHLRRIAGSLTPEAIEQDFVPSAVLSREMAVFEQELKQTRDKLVQAFRAQDRFISSVSHELKTPIAVLLTEGQSLPLKELDPRSQKFVLSVGEEMRRLGRMIESFLMLTRIRGGQGKGTDATCAANDFVMEAVAGCATMAAQRRVVLLPNLTESDPPLLISGDCDLLKIMVDNLIRNAIRFSPEGGQVVIHVADYETQCAVFIRDFGPGIPEEIIDHLFDRFVQAPEETRHGRGYGLGLSIAQGIAELHGGHITVRNVPEGGCEFKVLLPRAQVTPALVVG
jgi:signal transduction histidine kinase